jgi:hypothetical protein
MKKVDPNKYPPGLSAKKVAQIISYYDAKQDHDLLDDPDHELIPTPTAWLEVPLELVPRVRKLVAQHRKSA